MSLKGYQVLEKVVRKSGNSGCVYLPPTWEGCKVLVVLADEVGSD